LCLPRTRNGLGFVANPALGLHYLGPKALQRKRRNQGLVIAADDPSDLLPTLDPYWRALYATLCYTGLRVAELAALAWNRVDAPNRLIHVLPSPEYTELKSELSERSIKPFKELWPFLESYRSSTSGTGLIFPRPTSCKSWFLAVDGQGKVNHLSRDLSRALKRAGLADIKEPGRRARRYWETRMRSIGRADLIPVMGGHTDAVGRDHYTDSKRIVASVAGDDF
jgi:integrase